MITYEEMKANPPNVFISYSWTSEEHVAEVVEFATLLRQNGINVILDKWDLQPGQNVYKFMESMVNDPEVSKVLIICDRGYTEKANSAKGGVGTETLIISPEIYGKISQTKFIAVIWEFDVEGKPCWPTFLKGTHYFDYSNPETQPEEFEKILRNIVDKPQLPKPEIGEIPTYLFEDEDVGTKTRGLSRAFKNAVYQGKSNSIGIYQNYLSRLYRILSNDFNLSEEPVDNEFDDRVFDSINRFISYRDELVEMVELCIQFSMPLEFYKRLRIFLERCINLAYPHGFTRVGNDIVCENYRFILWELFLHITSLLIRNRMIDEFNILIDQPYLLESNGNSETRFFTIFRPYIRIFDQHRNNRLSQNKKSLSTHILIERVPENIKEQELIQADFILFLRGRGYTTSWYPFTLIYSGRRSFEFFQRAKSVVVFQALLSFTGFGSKDGMVEFFSTHPLSNDRNFVFFDIYDLVDLNELGTV